MKPTPTRLALLISVIGLGMPAGQRALAEEDEVSAPSAEAPAAPLQQAVDPSAAPAPQQPVAAAVAPLAQAPEAAAVEAPLLPVMPAAPVVQSSIEVVLGLSQTQVRTSDDAVVKAPVHVSPEVVRRAIWALGLDDGTPAELHEPDEEVVAAAPVESIEEVPDVSMVEKIDWAPPEATVPVAPLVAQLPAHVPAKPHGPTPAPAREQPALPLREPMPPQQPELQREASLNEAKPKGEAREEGLFGKLGKLLRSIFITPEPPQAVAKDEAAPSPAIAQAVEPAADEAAFTVAQATLRAAATEAAEPAAPVREIVVATHADKVLLSLAALRDADNEERSAQTKEIVVPTQTAKVLANLEDVQRESKARRALEKRESVAAMPAVDFETIEQVAVEPAPVEPLMAEFERVGQVELAVVSVEPLAAEFEAVEPVELAAAPVEPLMAEFETIEQVELASAPVEPLVAAFETIEQVAVLEAPAEAARFERIGQVRLMPLPAEPPLDGVAIAMDDNRLDRVRGGFTATNGLQVSFGIERAVYINGNLVTTTSLNLSSLGKMTTGQGQPVSVDTSSLALIQSGAGNTFIPGAVSPSAVTTVIQNTLDGQKIQNLTVINATVNSLQILKGLQLQNSVTNAIADSLRR